MKVNNNVFVWTARWNCCQVFLYYKKSEKWVRYLISLSGIMCSFWIVIVHEDKKKAGH